MKYHVLQKDTVVGDDGKLHTWDNFSTIHDALVSTSCSMNDFIEASLAKFLLANDIPEEDKDCYMAILAFQGDPRNTGLVNDDKSRFELMSDDSG